MLARRRDEIGEPVQELKRRELDDAVRSRSRRLAAATGSDPIVSPSSGQAPRIEVYSPHYAMATHLDFEMIGTFYGYRPDDVTGVLVSSFWDPNHDVLLTLPARRNQNLRSTYHLCGELACTPSGGSGGHGH